MTMVTEYDWESDTFTHHGDNSARQAWREAVAAIAEKAKAKLPECNGRMDKAVALVLAGDVELLPDGTAKVASQSNGTTIRRYAEVEPRIKTGIDSRLGGETLCLSHCGYTSWRCCI